MYEHTTLHCQNWGWTLQQWTSDCSQNICSSRRLSIKYLLLIWTFVFQFCIGTGQDQHQISQLRQCRTLCRDSSPSTSSKSELATRLLNTILWQDFLHILNNSCCRAVLLGQRAIKIKLQQRWRDESPLNSKETIIEYSDSMKFCLKLPRPTIHLQNAGSGHNIQTSVQKQLWFGQTLLI